MSRQSPATLLPSAVSIAHAQNCVPIALEAIDGAVVGPKRDLRRSGRPRI